MRKLTAVFSVVLFLCMLLSSCSTTNESEANGSESETSQIDTQEWMHTECSKDYVKEFMSILETVKGDGLLSGYDLDEEHC